MIEIARPTVELPQIAKVFETAHSTFGLKMARLTALVSTQGFEWNRLLIVLALIALALPFVAGIFVPVQ